MNKTNIKVHLDHLAELQSARDMLALEKQRLISDAIPAEVKQRLDELEAEFSGKAETVSNEISQLEAQIKQMVVEFGASVKGDFFHAVYNKGRITWDTKQLDGMAILIPELNQARKVGEPTVSLRMKGSAS